MLSKKTFAKPELALAGVVISVVLFALTQHVVFALATIALVFASFYFETKQSKDPLRDLAHNIAFALGAWALVAFILNTTSPINIITSCSMLPDYERGDLIFLSGYAPVAPRVLVNASLAGATYEPYVVQTPDGRPVGRILQPSLAGKPLFEPSIEVCDRKTPSGLEPELCLKSARFQNQTISLSKNNSVVVYDSNTPAGLIIHRAYALLEASDGRYLLTKGDNNPFLDQQTGFKLIKIQEEQRVLLSLPFAGGLTTRGVKLESDLPHKGNVFLRIPYLGYVKLLVFLQIAAPPGCDSVLQN